MPGFRKPEKDLPMSSDPDSPDEVAIRVQGLSKCYQIYDNPRDRLKQFIVPRLRRLFRRPPKQYFREFWALKDVSFEVKKGETVGIIGRNGSGKSTLLQMICGTLHPTSGSIQTSGRIAALLELGSGFNPEFTGRENVYMNAAVLGLSTEEIDSRFKDIVVFAEIGDFIEQPVKTYSSGMMLRLAFAVIVHVDADILVVDEALAVGDVFFVQKCMRFLREFMEKGTVVFVSHDSGAVLNLCQSGVLLDEGVILSEGKPKHMMERYLESLHGAAQILESSTQEEDAPEIDDIKKPLRDMRMDFINQSNLRNDIEVFCFSDGLSGFGNGGVRITNVSFLDSQLRPLLWIVGGEEVVIAIAFESDRDLSNYIVGFQVKDRLGQVIFGDNTYLSYKDDNNFLPAKKNVEAKFKFQMPILPTGDYTVMAAIAEGSQENHAVLQWVHDALVIKVHSSMVCHGLIQVPMSKISVINT